jgi:predicted RNase H-like HicB family nuclease
LDPRAAYVLNNNTIMLTKYIEAAMRQAHYELMENGRCFGSVPKCKGAWAEGATVEECRLELQSVLEDWILLGLHLGHGLPVIDGINLNHKRRTSPTHAQAH